MNQSIIRQQEHAKSVFLISLALAIALIFTYSENVYFWQISKTGLSLSFGWALIPVCTLLVWSLFTVNFKFSRLGLDPRMFAASLFALFFLGWMTRGYSFLPKESFRGIIFWVFLLSFFNYSKLIKEKIFYYFLIFLSLGLFFFFFNKSNGVPIFSDDHPVFLYRLQLLKDHFPNIPVYTAEWAAGRDTLHLFATGTLNIFFLFIIPIYLFPLEQIYSGIVFAILFLINPWSSYFATRLWGYSRRLASLCGILALSSNALIYQWGLKYGTLGFVVSVSIIPLVISLLFLGFLGPSSKKKLEDISFKNALLLIFSTTLALAWSSIALILIPVIIYGLSTFFRQLGKKKLVFACFAISLITLPWMFFFWKEWNVNSFLVQDKELSTDVQQAAVSSDLLQTNSNSDSNSKNIKPKERAFRLAKPELSLEKSLEISRDSFIRFNVLILFLTLPGLTLVRSHYKKLYASIVFLCLFFGLVLAPRFPQLELERMLIVFAQLSILPTALCLETFFSRRDLAGSRFFGAVCLSYLFAGVVASLIIFTNRSYDKYSFAGKELKEVRAFIKSLNHIPGRLLFSGFVLHELDSGHLAILPKLTGREMLASSHLHNLWQYKQIFPESVLKAGDNGIYNYLKTFNVGIVAAHEKKWKQYFSEKPSYFKPLGKAGKFQFYETFFSKNYFIEGSGEILKANSSGLLLRIDTNEAVVKFRYLKHLKSNCDLFEEKIDFDESFIRLSNCKNKESIFIESKSFLERFFDK